MSTEESETKPSPAAEVYEPKPTLQYASSVGLQAGLVGALVSTVQNALGTHNRGAAGVLTRTGGTIGFFGMCSDCVHLACTSPTEPLVSFNLFMNN